MRRVIVAAILLALPVLGLAQQDTIRVENAWSRVATGRTGVVYLMITDTGAPDRLIRASSPIAASAELHESFTDHGVAKMRSVAALPVETGKTVALAPGATHIMLTGVKQPLNQGDHFPVTLYFEKAGSVTTTVTVQRAGGSMPMGHDAPGGMHMQNMPMQGGQRQ